MALRQCVDAADEAEQHERQRTVGVQQRQGQHQRGQPRPEAALALIAEPPQKIDGGQQHAPAEQRRPLGDKQIHNRIDPLDVFLHKIRRRCVKPRENARKAVGRAEKVRKPKPAAHKKQVKRQARLADAVGHAPRQLPEHAVHRQKRGQHRQQIRRAQVGPQHHKNAGDRLAQKRIAEPVRAAQQGIAGQKFTALRDIFDEPEVHRHIAVAALARVVRAVHQMQNVGVQQIQRDEHYRQQAGPQGPAVGVLRYAAQPRAAVQKRCPDARRGRCRQRDGGQCKAQYHRKQCRQHGQQRHAEPAAQRHDHRRRPVRHRPPGRQQTDGEKQGKIENGK